MDLIKILSVDLTIKPSFSYFLSLAKDKDNKIVTGVASGEGSMHTVHLARDFVNTKKTEMIQSYNNFVPVNGFSLSGNGSGLYCTGGSGGRTSALFKMTEPDSPVTGPEMNNLTGICSFSPAEDLIACAYWNSDQGMEIRFLYFDESYSTYIRNIRIPVLSFEYLINSLTWSHDGRRLIVTTGEIDDGFKGTNGSVDIFEKDELSDESKWKVFYSNEFTQVIEESAFNIDSTVAAFKFDDKVRFVDVGKGVVKCTKRKIRVDGMDFLKKENEDFLCYASYSNLYYMDVKTLKERLWKSFDEPVVKLKVFQKELSGHYGNLLFVLLKSGKLTIFKIE